MQSNQSLFHQYEQQELNETSTVPGANMAPFVQKHGHAASRSSSAKCSSPSKASALGSDSEGFEWSSDEVDSIDEPMDLADRGVSIDLLMDLLIEHDLENMSTREVVERFVMPQTADYGCSLSGLMKRSFPHAVGRATHYVIHPWDCNFGRLVRSLISVDNAYQYGSSAASETYEGDDAFDDDYYDGDVDGFSDDEEYAIGMHEQAHLTEKECEETGQGTAVGAQEQNDGHQQICLEQALESRDAHSNFAGKEIDGHIITPEPGAALLDGQHHGGEDIAGPCISAVATPNLGELDFTSTSKTTSVNGRKRQRRRQALFWIDIFAIDQHLHLEGYAREDVWLHRDQLLQSVRSLIESIPCACLFMDPSNGPVLVKRSWCLYESMQAVFYGSKFVLAYCPETSETARTLHPAIEDFGAAVEAFTPDFATSQTTLPQDKEWLLNAVAAAHPSGFRWLNEKVGQVMLHALAQEVLNDLYSAHPDLDQAPIQSIHQLAILLESLVCVEQANLQYLRALDLARDQLGEDHTLTLSIAHDLACLQAKHFHAFVQAEELLRATLEARQCRLGEHHPDTMETALALARLLQAQNRIDEAEQLFRITLERSLIEHGFSQRQSLVAANLLALLLQQRGELFEAYILLARTLSVGTQVLGRHHLDVLVWRNNLAVLLQDMEELDVAESLFRKALTDCESALGQEHPQTLDIVYNLGQCLWQQGKLRAAEMCFRRELVGCQTIYGPGHRDTIRSIRNMTEFLSSQGRQEEADKYLHELEAIDAFGQNASDSVREHRHLQRHLSSNLSSGSGRSSRASSRLNGLSKKDTDADTDGDSLSPTHSAASISSRAFSTL